MRFSRRSLSWDPKTRIAHPITQTWDQPSGVPFLERLRARGEMPSVPAESEDQVGEMRSLIGPQVDSRKETAPAYGFGTADRNSVQVIYGGGKAKAGGSGTRTTKLSPGPIYLPDDRRGTGPQFSFGGKGNAIGATGIRPAPNPGPGEYDTAGAVGVHQVASMTRTAPAYGWSDSTSRRDTGTPANSERMCDQMYEQTVAIGPQPLSTRKTQAAYAFGTAQRFIGEQSSLRRSAAAPGPGAYALRDSNAAEVKHQESTSRTQPAYGFGTARRFDLQLPKVGRVTPGPGGYKTKGGIGAQVCSERRSGASYGFGSARRFGDSALRASHRQTPGPGAYNG